MAAEHLGQGADRLSLTIARAFGIEPIALITQEIVESANEAPGVFQETQIRCDAAQHAIVGALGPETNAEAQSPRVVVGRIAALAPRDAVDGVLDQAGRVRHAVQVVQRNPITEVYHYKPPCMSSLDRLLTPGARDTPLARQCRTASFSDATCWKRSKYFRPTLGQNMGFAYW